MNSIAELEKVNPLPVLRLTGDFSGISSTQKVTLDMELENEYGVKIIEGKKCTLKWQGNSSLSYPKKNYSISLFEADGTTKYNVALFGDVPANNGYHLKANYIDATHARNIVLARLVNISYEDPLQARCVIDGFPVIIYENGVKKGIYTFNLKQDATVYGFDKANANHIMYRAEHNDGNLCCAFRALSVDNTPDASPDWEDKFPEKNLASNRDKLNRMIGWVMSCEGNPTKFKNECSQYWDVKYLIDYWIHCYVFGMIDSLGKNMNIVTYDGIIWYPTLYDMDSTIGLYWDGNSAVSPTTKCPEQYQMNNSLLWELVQLAYNSEIKTRYAQLRSKQLSAENIKNYLQTFINSIPSTEYASDQEIWTGIPSKAYGLDYMKTWIDSRLNYTDDLLMPIILDGTEPYKRGLIIWLDGFDGYSEETVWYDRNGSSRKVVLENFNFQGNSGWTGYSLSFDGINDIFPVIVEDRIKESIELNFRIKETTTSGYCVLIGDYTGKSYVAYRKDNKKLCFQLGWGWTTLEYVLKENEHINLVYRADGKIFINGEYAGTTGIQHTFANETIVGATFYMGNYVDNAEIELYSYRMYDDILLEECIKNNYDYETTIKRENIIPEIPSSPVQIGLSYWIDAKDYNGSTIPQKVSGAIEPVVTGCTKNVGYLNIPLNGKLLLRPSLFNFDTDFTYEINISNYNNSGNDKIILSDTIWGGVPLTYKSGIEIALHDGNKETITKHPNIIQVRRKGNVLDVFFEGRKVLSRDIDWIYKQEGDYGINISGFEGAYMNLSFGSYKFYNRSLTDSEILHNYEYEKSIERLVLDANIEKNNLICWLDGRACNGNTVIDNSGNGNDLSITNTTAQTFDGKSVFIEYETRPQILHLKNAEPTSATLEVNCRLIDFESSEAWILHTPSWDAGIILGMKDATQGLCQENLYERSILTTSAEIYNDVVITVVYDSVLDKEAIYVNGELKIPYRNVTNKFYDSLSFREYWSAQKSAWKLHSFKAYSRALSATEIKRNYDYEKSISRS